MDVRNLVIDISARDTATEAIEGINSLIQSINKSIVSVQFDTSSLDTARKAYEDVASKMSEPIKAAVAMDTSAVTDAIDDALKSSGLLGDAVEDVKDGEEELNNVVEKSSSISSQLSGVWATLSESGGGLKNTINNVTESINMTTVAIGALISVAANSAFKDVFLEDAFKQKFENEEGLVANEFMNKLPSYVNQDMMKRAMMSNKTNNVALDQSIKLLDTLSQVEFSSADWAGKRTAEDVMSTLNSLKFRARSFISLKGKTGATVINRQLTAAGLGEITDTDIKAAEASVKASGQWSRKSKDKEANLDKVFLEAARMAAEKKIKPIDWDNLLPFQKVQIMKSNLENLKSTIADSVVPALVNIVNMITVLVQTISKIPGAPTFLAYVSVFAAIAVIVSRLSGAFGAVAVAIKGATAAMALYQKVTIGQASFIGAKAGLNAPLQRAGNFLGSVGAINSVNAAGKVQLGILGSMGAAYAKVGATSILSLGGIKGALLALSAGAKAAFRSMLLSAQAFFTFLMANPYVALGAIIIAIVLLAYKWGYLQRAWDRFSKSNFGKDVISAFWTIKSIIWVIWEKMVSFLDLNFSGGIGALKSGFEFVANIIDGIFTAFDGLYTALKSGNLSLVFEKGGDLASSLGMISPMFYFISLIFRFIKALYEFLKDPVTKMRDFLSWIYEVLSGLWSWLMKAIPGAEKSSLANDIAEQAAKEGLKFLETGEHAGEFKKRTPAGEWVLGGAPSAKLAGIVEKWKNTPGFAEGIADAVKKGISGIGDTIASKLKSALDGIFGEGTFDGVVSSLLEVAKKLGEFIKEMIALFGGGDIVAKNDEVKIYRTDEAGKFKVVKINDFWFDEGLGTMSSADIKSKYGLDAYAAGTDYVPKTGPYILHQGEAVIPAALNKNMSTTNNSTSNFYNTFNFHKHGTSSGFDTKEKAELTKLIDDYISKQIRHRQGH